MADTVIWTLPHRIKVVEVERRCASPRSGEDQVWTEYQVREGRHIRSRHDLRRVAKIAADAMVKAIDDERAKLNAAERAKGL